MDEVRSMALDDFTQSEIFANQRMAQHHLNQLRAAAWPHAKKTWQDSHYKETCKMAFDKRDDGPTFSTAEFATLISGRGSNG